MTAVLRNNREMMPDLAIHKRLLCQIKRLYMNLGLYMMYSMYCFNKRGRNKNVKKENKEKHAVRHCWIKLYLLYCYWLWNSTEYSLFLVRASTVWNLSPNEKLLENSSRVIGSNILPIVLVGKPWETKEFNTMDFPTNTEIYIQFSSLEYIIHITKTQQTYILTCKEKRREPHTKLAKRHVMNKAFINYERK